MMTRLLAAFLVFLPFLAFTDDITGDPNFHYPPPATDNGEILVDFQNEEPDEEIEGFLTGLGIKSGGYSWLSREENWLRIGSLFSSLRDRFRKNPDVEAIEPNYYFSAMYVPNDPYYKHQWHLDLIGMKEAWEYPRGSEVVVAVIDTGIAYEQFQNRYRVEDLSEAQFVKPYNFIRGNEHANDDHGHGTHVAGTIAQLTNNGLGVAGVAPQVKLMPLKVLNASGYGTIADIAAAIRYAADNGAAVINMSLGGPFPSLILRKAIKYAKEKDVIIVCAAGNGGRSGLSYPAAYPECISVSAVRYDRSLSWYSSYGEGLTIAAPGGDMNVDQNGDGLMDGVLQNTLHPQDAAQQGYFLFQGTSMAAPHVAGAAALLVSQGIQDPEKVREILESSASPVSGGSSEKYGAGILNVHAALKSAFTHRKFKILSLSIVLFLALLALINRRRKDIEKVGMNTRSIFGLILGATGFFFIAGWIPSSVSFFLTHSAIEWHPILPVHSNEASFLFWSALPALAITLLCFPWKKTVPIAFGFAVGTAAFLLYQVFSPAAGVTWIPGSFLESIWLLTNALLASGLAVIASFRLK